MQFVSGIVVFIIVWWGVFFLTLPFAVEAQGPNADGGVPAAPKKTRLKKKIIVTTCIAVLISSVIIYMINFSPVDFRSMATQMMVEDGLMDTGAEHHNEKDM